MESSHRHSDAASDRGSQDPPCSRASSFQRATLLLSACFLSVGCHFGSYLLGPLKSQISKRLEASETDFAALVSSFQLINSLTPLLGFLIPRWGLSSSALICTGTICLGQVIVYFSERHSTVGGMLVGLFISGLGISPVAVVQESIILRYFGTDNAQSVDEPHVPKNRRSIAVASGLLLGKLSSYVASVTAIPLSKSRLGPHSPFAISALLSLASLFAAVVFAVTKRAYHRSSDPRVEVLDAGSEDTRLHKRAVRLGQTVTFGDQFWVYMALCGFSGGLWFPFIHLSTDLLSTLFSSSPERSAFFASWILLFTVILYPIFAALIDGSHPSQATSNSMVTRFLQCSTRPRALLVLCTLLTLTSLLTLGSSWARNLLGQGGAVVGFALGRGLAPLLLVVIAPDVVDPKYVSTALGMHKALEMASATIVQTLAGYLLAGKLPTVAYQLVDTGFGGQTSRVTNATRTIRMFTIVNFLEAAAACTLLKLETTKDPTQLSPSVGSARDPVDSTATGDETRPLLSERPERHESSDPIISAGVRWRGRVGLGTSVAVVALSWAAYAIVTAIRR